MKKSILEVLIHTTIQIILLQLIWESIVIIFTFILIMDG